MKKFVIAAALAGMAWSGQAQTFSKTAKGLEYRFLKNEPGKAANEGDELRMFLSVKLGDSTVYDSRKLTNGQAVPYVVAAPKFNGDIAEGFTLLSAGDQAIFRAEIDSLRAKGFQLPPTTAKYMEYVVEVVSVLTPEDKKALVKVQAQKDDQLIKDYLKKNKISAARTASGLYWSVQSLGKGRKPVPGDKVSMNYTGKLTDGTPFDSNVDPKFGHVQPFDFVLGQGQVIQGWDEGIALLSQGTKATLFIPSAMAYGTNGQGPIPENSILVFDVEVRDVTHTTPGAPANGGK